jgi:hypothetical protein
MINHWVIPVFFHVKGFSQGQPKASQKLDLTVSDMILLPGYERVLFTPVTVFAPLQGYAQRCHAAQSKPSI